MKTGIFLWVSLILFFFHGCTTKDGLRVEGLACEYLVNPFLVACERAKLQSGGDYYWKANIYLPVEASKITESAQPLANAQRIRIAESIATASSFKP